jgi:hypothetical protein
MKVVLHLKGVRKPIIINKTNALALSEEFGKDFDTWVGKRVTVQAEPTTFGGKRVMGLRLYPVTNGDTLALKAPKKNKPAAEVLNDELPDDL